MTKDKTSVLAIDLPEVADRSPFTVPRSHLIKTGTETWAETAGRRPSMTSMVNRIREAVDAWREEGYPGASATSSRLLQFWFEETHVLPNRTAFRYFFCQREAIETVIYLYEVRGFRDCFEIVSTYFEEPEGTQLELGVTTKGQRKIRRYIPEIAKEAEQYLPREGLTRMAVKMATGSGKTVVMGLAMVWSYLHRRFEHGSDLADNFLVIAPNVIVFERLKVDLEGGRMFHELPLVPPEWRGEWQVDVILRGEAKMPRASGNIFVTNIQQIYEREPVDDAPINPIAALLGNKPPAKIHAPVPMLDRVRTLSNVMVLNDEAHHLWDDTLRWNETLLELDDHFKHEEVGGLVAWLDFSATPKNQNGTFYPWIVVDYPLAQAVEDRIVVRTPPKPGKRVYPLDERRKLDIVIPHTTAMFEREVKNVESLDPAAFGPIGTEENLTQEVIQRVAPPIRQSVELAPAGEFDEVLALIETARQRAYQAVNTELVGLYWQLGAYISDKIESAQWGDGVVDELAAAIARQYPGLRGYTRRNLFRMRQFFEAYRDHEKVSPLVSQLPWTHHLIILGRTKYPEEREFYMLSAIQGRWTKRELERQIRSGAALRTAPGGKKVSPALAQIHPTAAVEFKNEYSREFLGLPGEHSEADLHGALLRNLGRFITEFGRDFCFVGSEYPVQVGKQDFAIDLLFFHRGLACLVAFELKVREFRPEDLGKLSFYVEALDRDVRKDHERPSIGVLLCATKDNEVVEYALARTSSPTLVAEYQTVLPSKELLRRKLHELYARLAPAERTAPTSKAISAKSEALPEAKAAPKKGKGKGKR